jgi:hypothetical protein
MPRIDQCRSDNGILQIHTSDRSDAVVTVRGMSKGVRCIRDSELPYR